MDSESEPLLMSSYTSPETFFKLHAKRHTSLMILLLLNTIILTSIIGGAVYFYYHNVKQIVPETTKALERWNEVYNQMQPYLNRIDELFDMIDEFETLESEGKAAWPLAEAFIVQITTFIQNSETFITWSQQCIENKGICPST